MQIWMQNNQKGPHEIRLPEFASECLQQFIKRVIQETPNGKKNQK